MSAGRDVERLISDWLTDEARDRSRDRVLAGVRQAVERTPQRRFAAWREPVYLSSFRLAAAAAVILVAVLGAGAVGRLSAPPAGGSQPTAAPTLASTPAPTEDQNAALVAYRGARNEICNGYAASLNPLKEQLDGIHDPETSAADRSAKAGTLLTIVTELEAMVAQLDELEAPEAIADGHDAYVTRYQDMNLFIRDMLARVNAGDLEGAAAVDDAINVLNGPMLAFEDDNSLDICP